MEGFRIPQPIPVDPIAARIEAILADVELDREDVDAWKLDSIEELYGVLARRLSGWNCLVSLFRQPAERLGVGSENILLSLS